MFWILVLLSGLAITFVKVGMMSVTIRILECGLLAATLVIMAGAIAWIWRRITGS